MEEKNELENIEIGETDDALVTLKELNVSHAEITDQERKKVLRKIDFWMMPIMIMTFMLQYYDKAVLGQAALFGFLQSLDLQTLVSAGPPPVYSTIRFSQVSIIFYCGYIAGCYPLSLLAQRFNSGSVCGILVTLWGICQLCTIGCFNFPTILVARFFLGFLESGIGPSFLMITSRWYTSHEQAFRVGIWYSFSGGSNMWFPLLSYAMAIIPGPLAPWKNIYIFSGTLTIVWGIVCYFIMPDSPLDAKFFNDRERYVAIERIRKNNAGVTNHHIKWSQVREALMDPQVYLLMLMSFCSTTPNGAVSTFGPILVKNMGFTSNLINLCLQVPTGFVGMTAVLVATFLARKYNGIRLYLAMLFSCVVMAGSLILWLAHRNQTAVLMVGYYMIQTLGVAQCLTYGLGTSNYAGNTKKVIGNATIFLGWALGNIMSPLLFKAQQAPVYADGFIQIVVGMSALIVMAIILKLLLVRRNRKREETWGPAQYDHAFSDLTDLKNLNFRYQT